MKDEFQENEVTMDNNTALPVLDFEADNSSIEEVVEDYRDVPFFFALPRPEQMRALESLIFASDAPLTIRNLNRLLVYEESLGADPAQQPLPFTGSTSTAKVNTFSIPSDFYHNLVDELNAELEAASRPYRVILVAGGFQFATTPQYGQLVQKLLRSKSRKRLTQAALETLAIVAYRQPVTKVEIDAVRGVNSGEVVNSLIEKELVSIVGRAETPGKPLLYGATEDFLHLFGLNSISDLPRLREVDDLLSTTATLIEASDQIDNRLSPKDLRKHLAYLLEADTFTTDSPNDNLNEQTDADLPPTAPPNTDG